MVCEQPFRSHSVRASACARQFVVQGEVGVALLSGGALVSRVAVARVVERPHHEMAVRVCRAPCLALS